ncbi:MAG: hypothetical protein CL561_03305 [Alphaproteobacteria bacterium]|nr:hypothetical protein [Alphaproteobacteria bacterium]
MNFKKFPVLRLFFNDPAAKTPAQLEHERQFERLRSWMAGLPEFMTKHLDATLNKARKEGADPAALKSQIYPHNNMFQLVAGNGCSKQGHIKGSATIDVDGAAFSREEMAALQDELHAIHDIALAYNVDIGFAGFDNLPRKLTVARNSTTAADSVLFFVDTERTYNYLAHPEYKAVAGEIKALETRLNNRFVAPKPQGPDNSTEPARPAIW